MLGSVQFQMVSVCSGRPICAPPHLSGVSPNVALETCSGLLELITPLARPACSFFAVFFSPFCWCMHGSSPLEAFQTLHRSVLALFSICTFYNQPVRTPVRRAHVSTSGVGTSLHGAAGGSRGQLLTLCTA